MRRFFKTIKKVSRTFLWKSYFSKKEQLTLIFILIFGMCVRFVNALSTILWRDEVYTLAVARSFSIWQLLSQQHWDTAHPPTYTVLLHIWALVSNHPLWLRIPSLFISIGILYIVPIFALLISNNKRVAFLFFFLFSISHTQISLNMVVRQYPFVIFVCFLSFIIFLSFFKNRLRESHLFLLIFTLINTIGFYVDYSFIWLLSVYGSLFVWGLFFDTLNRKRYMHLLLSLGVTFLLSFPILYLIKSNLAQSLHLESGAQMKFVQNTEKNILAGKKLEIGFDIQRKTNVSVQSDGKELHRGLIGAPSDFEGTKYVGINIPPLSGLIIRQLSHCSTLSKSRTCVYHDITDKLRASGIKSIISKKLGSNVLFFNIHPSEWRSYILPIDTVPNTRFIGIRFAFASIQQNPSSQIVFIASEKKNLRYIDDQNTKTMFTFYNRNYLYEMNGQTGIGKKIINSDIIVGKTFFDKFGEDALFFTSLPSYTDSTYIHIAFFALFIGLFIYLIKVLLHPSYSIMFIFIMLLLPPILSVLFSLSISPIFVGRNLYISAIAMLFVFSQIVSDLLSRNALVNKIIGMGLLIGFFIAFMIRFPFLHYTDPPYLINRILYTIHTDPIRPGQKKMVILANPDHYLLPMQYYYETMYPRDENRIIFSTLTSYHNVDKKIRQIHAEDVSYKYYFLEFGYEMNLNASEKFSSIANERRCEAKTIQSQYVFFARCIKTK